MEKGEEGTRLTQVTISALNEEKEIIVTKIMGTPNFENLSVFIRADSADRITNVLEMQSGSKICSFGVDAEW